MEYMLKIKAVCLTVSATSVHEFNYSKKIKISTYIEQNNLIKEKQRCCIFQTTDNKPVWNNLMIKVVLKHLDLHRTPSYQ